MWILEFDGVASILELGTNCGDFWLLLGCGPHPPQTSPWKSNIRSNLGGVTWCPICRPPTLRLNWFLGTYHSSFFYYFLILNSANISKTMKMGLCLGLLSRRPKFLCSVHFGLDYFTIPKFNLILESIFNNFIN